ncbi:MAG: 16S rRNA (guanine(966)-N(2))-methyltransferase RsmD [Clostridiales bacterium]|nr:16S rRNA (guanine(966)-N(2))-methyltransferase RsmD [Clostridiales bacterium]
MKIISGEFKYRNIEIPIGIRPTTEKVREAVFSMIDDWIPSAVVFDMFAGSGVMGLEALSRGALKCYFNEGNRQNFRVLKANVDHCKAEDKSVLMNYDYLNAINRIDDKLDIIIIDPPYENLEYYDKVFTLVHEKNLLKEGGILVVEHLFKDKMKDEYNGLKKVKEKKYGTIGVDVFIKEDILII